VCSAGSRRSGRSCRWSTGPQSRSGTPVCAGPPPASRRATRSRPGRPAWRNSAPSSSPRTEEPQGLAEAVLRYEGEPPTPAALEERLERDLDRGVTGLGPHLDDVAIASGTRELRSFGSQGEQRLVVLALLLAEAELLAERRGGVPLLLLDDVLSELDPARRRILAARVAGVGQALVTATDAAMLPASPDQLLEVSPGKVREAA